MKVPACCPNFTLLSHQAYQYLTSYKQRIAPAEICGCSAGTTAFLVVLFGVFAIGVFPIFSRFHESSIIMGADVLQRLFVLAVFVAGVGEKGLDDLTAIIFLAVSAGDVTSG